MNGHTCIRENNMKRIFAPQSKTVLAVAALVFTVALGAGAALAQSGHFVGDVTCEDIGTQLECSGKVAGLGGTTFQITVEVTGATADVTCTNPGQNPAPGQAFDFVAVGDSGPQPTPRNGQFRFDIRTVAPTAPAGSCPNPQWTATVTDVDFSGTTATVTLTEDGVVSDSVTVPIP
jgi:hypothetical protein